jgi:hypothetical protein
MVKQLSAPSGELPRTIQGLHLQRLFKAKEEKHINQMTITLTPDETLLMGNALTDYRARLVQNMQALSVGEMVSKSDYDLCERYRNEYEQTKSLINKIKNL